MTKSKMLLDEDEAMRKPTTIDDERADDALPELVEVLEERHLAVAVVLVVVESSSSQSRVVVAEPARLVAVAAGTARGPSGGPA